MGRRGFDADDKSFDFLRVFWAPLVVAVPGAVLALLSTVLELDHLWFRLGMALAISGGLWLIANGFSIGILRVSTALVLITLVVALTRIGNDTRDQVEATRYESTKSELGIELGLLGSSDGIIDDSAAVLAEAQQRADAAWSLADDATATALVALSNAENRAPGANAFLAGIIEMASEARAAATAADAAVAALTDAPAAISDPVTRAAAAATIAASAAADVREAVDEVGEIVVAAEKDHDPRPGENRPADAREALGIAQREANVATEAAGSAERAEREAKAAWVDELAEARRTSRAPEGERELELAYKDALASSSRADASARMALVAAATAEQDILLFGPCGGLLEELATSVAFQDATACGDILIAGCTDPAGSSSSGDPSPTGRAGDNVSDQADRCTPRRAQQLVLGSYLGELTRVARSAEVEEREDLEKQIEQAQDRIDALAEPVPIVDLITAGADDLVTDFISTVTDEDIPVGLARLGWVVLAVALIILYRWLEAANDRRQPGPVSVEAANVDSNHAAERFRIFLGRVDLGEPPAVPGGEVVSSAAEVMKGEQISSKVIQFVAAVFQSTAFPKRGVEIEVSRRAMPRGLVETPAEGTDAANEGAGDSHASEDTEYTEILVRGIRRRNGALLFAQQFVDELEIRAVSRAAYFAAAKVLDEGYTTPGWNVWRTEATDGFRSYQRVANDADQIPAADRRRLLERAVDQNPSTGVALVALANNLSLTGELIRPAQLALMARERDPRFLTARYRLGATLSMIAGDMQRNWDDDPDRVELLAWLEGQYGPKTFVGDDRGVLLGAAYREFDDSVKMLRRRRILWQARRQRERAYWLRIFRSSDRMAVIQAMTSAGLLAEVRAARYDQIRPTLAVRQFASTGPTIDLPWHAKLRRRTVLVDGEVSDWMFRRMDKALRKVRYDDGTVRYNAACLDVEAGRMQSATEHLHAARFAKGGEAISRSWIEIDPDLAGLRASGWWQDVLDVYEPAAREGTTE